MSTEFHEAPRDTAYWDLRGVIGQWMDETASTREDTLRFLANIMADIRCGVDCNRAWRLTRLEEAVARLVSHTLPLDAPPPAEDLDAAR